MKDVFDAPTRKDPGAPPVVDVLDEFKNTAWTEITRQPSTATAHLSNLLIEDRGSPEVTRAPGPATPGDTKPGDTKPGAPPARPGDIKPDATKPGDTKPGDKADLAVERKQLDDQARAKMSPEEYARFRESMKQFEARKAKDGLSDEEIARTYKQVSRLLTASGETPLTGGQRKNLAMQVMDNAAKPTEISQGQNNTCSTAAAEVAVYTRSPSDAARIVADVALTRQYTTRQGNVVHVDPSPRSSESTQYPNRPDGSRTHASEIFQITAANVYYKDHGIPLYYELEPTRPHSKAAGGERLLDTSEMGKMYPEIKNRDGNPKESPGLTVGDVVDIVRLVTGKRDTGGIQNDWYGGKDDRVTHVNSLQDLNDKLADAKRNHKFPMLVLVNTAVEPMWTDSGAGIAGGSGGAHVINITDYQPGPPATVSIDNQWTSGDDYQGDKKMPVEDLFRLMLNDREATADLQKQVDATRAKGQVDVAKELDLLRMKNLVDKISPEENQRLLDELIKRVNEDFAKRGAKVSIQERSQTRMRLLNAANSQPQAQKAHTLKSLKEAGITDKD